MLCMIGALVAEPVALGDIGQVYMTWNIDKEYGQRLFNAGTILTTAGGLAIGTGIGAEVGLIIGATGVITMA
ncbi:hypothetical protein [Methanocaldococcus infernus]|nr:hypothetical protein [Methanocaldococcus infernus]